MESACTLKLHAEAALPGHTPRGEAARRSHGDRKEILRGNRMEIAWRVRACERERRSSVLHALKSVSQSVGKHALTMVV